MLEQMESKQMEMLALACHSARLGSWRLERDSNRITLSESFCRLLKLPGMDELSMQYDVFNARHIHSEDSWFVRDYQYAPPLHQYSFRAVCADGTERWLEAFPAVNDSRVSDEISGVVQDITERVVKEDDLRHARKMESIRSIAGGIAHEFNNILYSVSGYIGLIKDLLDDAASLDLSEMTEYVGEVEYGTQRAVRLIKKIQTFSHSGRQGISRVNLSEAVEKALTGTSYPENVTFSFTSRPGSLVWVYVNETILSESLNNVISNGIASMAQSGGNLQLVVDEVFEEENRPVACGAIRTGYYGRVSISDEGCGMDKNTISRIFEPFFTTRQAGQGTGLGLAIVYGMVNAAGGAAEVASQPGKGTRFRIYLPSCSAMPREKMSNDADIGN